MRVYLAKQSRNSKTGPIPVSTTSSDSCPGSCAMRAGCYAKANFHLRLHWGAVDRGERGGDWESFCLAIAALPEGQLWRHNQAGDLPGVGDVIDSRALADLVTANLGKRGFTYTHKPVGRPFAASEQAARNGYDVAQANANGFTINLSANNLEHADELAALEIAPVAVVLPAAVRGNVKVETPSGRRVVVCPATYREEVTCASCGLCAVRDRQVIVGFPAHGAATKAADAVAKGV